MTIINCSSNCVYQKDGKCNLNKTKSQTLKKYNDNCAYFKEKNIKN